MSQTIIIGLVIVQLGLVIFIIGVLNNRKPSSDYIHWVKSETGEWYHVYINKSKEVLIEGELVTKLKD